MKLNTKKEKEIEKLLLKVNQLEKVAKDNEFMMELPSQIKFPPSTKNYAVKKLCTNLTTPFMNEGTKPFPAENGQIREEGEPSDRDSSFFVSERIVKQVMKAIDPEEESQNVEQIEKASKNEQGLITAKNSD